MAAVVTSLRFFRPFLFVSLLLLLSLLLRLVCAVSDSQALLKLKESFDNAGGGALDSWNSDSVPCNKEGHWKGLLCFNGILMGLRLEGMGLSGKIDIDALLLIKELRSFSVINNSFTGNIPEINRLGYLKSLFLSKNKFSGEIPSDFFAGMRSLKKVWLSDNKFSGKIPDSLSKLSRLIYLRLENNQFSGEIPDFHTQTLISINLSNNKLEGEIPSSLSKFKGNVFAGNPGLCGSQLGIDCGRDDKDDIKKIIAAVITLGVMLLAMIIFFVMKWRGKKRKSAPGAAAVERGRSNEQVEIQVSLPATIREVGRKTASHQAWPGNYHGMVRGGAVPELVMVNDEKGVFGLPSLMKATAQVLGNSALGSSYKATMSNGFAVVVKRTKEMNSIGKDEFDVMAKRLGKLKHPNVMTPLAYHYRVEEKLFVYDYVANGSLLYLLHGDHETSSSALDWPTRLKIVQGIAEGLDYIHVELASLDVAHGNLKSSNVLLGPDNQPLLSEYGFGSMVSTEGAKTLIAYKTPEAIQHGKVCHKSDVYCLGIIILEILTGKFPSQYLDNGEGGIDVVHWVTTTTYEGKQANLFDPEIASGSKSLQEMEKLLQIGSLCTQASPDERLDLKKAIKMIQEIRVDNDTPESESDPQAITITVLPSAQDEVGDAKSNSDLSSIQESNV
ncbi:pollen receptor-like kinase 3 [Gossypium australe]|uniref:Pollen receptor-like kinase 3 n=1 Tax=Gossypium australe TaxID=47621 RepID=A0A5B6WCA8_9ROSI|nr:pollen receptor-like kinase 3 [Gossypium australe]